MKMHEWFAAAILVAVASIILMANATPAYAISQTSADSSGTAPAAAGFAGGGGSAQAANSGSGALGGAGQSVTIPIKVVNGRYDPNIITVKQGTKVRLELDKGSFVGCMTTFNIWGLNIRQNAQQNNIVEFVADKPGTYKTSCPMGMGDGKFIVEAASGNEAAAAQNTAQAVAAAPKAGSCGMGGGCGCGG